MDPADFPTFPLTLYNPIYGARTAKTADEVKTMFTDPTQWFKTAIEADQHRTDTDASIAVAYRLKNRVDHALGDDHPVSDKVVENSVVADQRIRSGDPEP
jgi:hypothetical protein